MKIDSEKLLSIINSRNITLPQIAVWLEVKRDATIAKRIERGQFSPGDVMLLEAILKETIAAEPFPADRG